VDRNRVLGRAADVVRYWFQRVQLDLDMMGYWC
jgi:hypothetical protein